MDETLEKGDYRYFYKRAQTLRKCGHTFDLACVPGVNDGLLICEAVVPNRD